MITDLDDVWHKEGCGGTPHGRRRYRLLIVFAIGASYAIDATFLGLFAAAGVIRPVLPIAFAAAGLLHVAVFGWLHWSGISERASNPHLTEWQMIYAILVQLAGMVLMPELAVYFLALIFIVFGFATLRLGIRSALAAWLLTSLGVGYLLVDGRVAMTNTLNATTFVAVTSWFAYASVLLRCILLGYYVSRLRGRIFYENLRLADDIAERKRIEAELERHRRHLEEIVAERTLALSIAKEAAETANRAKSAFLANMSHELRTPLNAIMGMNDLAMRRATDAKQADYLGKVSQASRRLLSLIDDILDISHLEANRLTLEEHSFFIADVVDEAMRMQRSAADAKGLVIVSEMAPDLPAPVRGDPLRLRQVLLNFLSNAVKFSDRGQITVRAQAIQRTGDAVLLRVEVVDQGIGVGDDQQACLFRLFTQGDDSSTRMYGGAGLGLVITRRLVECMGGDVGAESRPGVGSTFWATVKLRTEGVN